MSGLELKSVIEVLGGKKVLRQQIRRPADMVAAVRSGLPAAALEVLAEHLQAALSEVIEVAGITTTTWNRRRGRTLNEAESDRLVRIARVVALAESVFEDAKTARGWLFKPNRALGGETPFHLLDTEIGAEQVATALERIEYGVYS